ncbi:MAG: hypothetical protein ACTSYA_07315 [Candidatus Kariarchaeaceae archaeon]
MSTWNTDSTGDFIKALDYRRTVYSLDTRRTYLALIERFAEGLAIPPIIIERSELRYKDLLIALEDTEFAFEQICDSFERINFSRPYSIVIGDYGSGKSQIKNRIIEWLSKSAISNALVIVDINLGQTNFIYFVEEFIHALKETIERLKVDISSYAYLFNEYSLEMDNQSARGLVNKIIKRAASDQILFSFHFDELDQIQTMENFAPWANWIVNYHDTIDRNSHVVFYASQRDLSELLGKDTRLARLDRYIYNPFELSSSYYDKIYEGAANIIAIYERANNLRFSKNAIQAWESLLMLKRTVFSRYRIRQANTRVYNLCRIIHEFDKTDIWSTLDLIKHWGAEALENQVKKAVVDLLNSIGKLDFQIDDDDFIFEFSTQQMLFHNSKSDGKFKMYKKVSLEYQFHEDIPFKLLFVNNGEIERSKLAPIKDVIQSTPLIFLTVNALESQEELIIQYFQEEYEKGKILYLNIRPTLLEPIVGIEKNKETSKDRLLYRAIENWFREVTDFDANVRVFMESQVSVKQTQLLEDKIEELRALVIRLRPQDAQAFNETWSATEIEDVESHVPSIRSISPRLTQKMTPYPPAPGAPSRKEIKPLIKPPEIDGAVAFALIALYETVSSRKSKSVTLRYIINTLRNKKITASADEVNLAFLRIIKSMVLSGFLTETKMFIVKEDKWDREAVLNFLLDKYFSS